MHQRASACAPPFTFEWMVGRSLLNRTRSSRSIIVNQRPIVASRFGGFTKAPSYVYARPRGRHTWVMIIPVRRESLTDHTFLETLSSNRVVYPDHVRFGSSPVVSIATPTSHPGLPRTSSPITSAQSRGSLMRDSTVPLPRELRGVGLESSWRVWSFGGCP